ncbi:MAG TPA: imidazoleglycerol-phosphate dehydratase HisB [Thermoanaerobaculia bacterium]|nr:imidazoleglycerol-phosphate dehydratase HisB [Thermoanaerobaculia bacterium]
MNVGSVERSTKETSIRLELGPAGRIATKISTPVGFLDHMLDTIARHAGIGLSVEAKGDVHIDFHHTVEDTGLAFGEALEKSLGDKRGIRRFGHAYVPLDEALARVVVDLSGRPYFAWEVPFDREMLLVTPDFPFALVEEFFKSVAFRGRLNLHAALLSGRNGHHAAEAITKAFARALREATAPSGDAEIASTKGTLV